MAANGKRFRRRARFRAGFIRGETGSRRKNLANSKQIAESEAKSVAQEKEANDKEKADPGKEKEGKSFTKKKESNGAADLVTKRATIAETGTTIGGDTDTTIADATCRVDAGSHRSVINITRLHSASRGREVWVSRRSGLRTAAEPDAASWLVVVVAAGNQLPIPFAIGPE
ncbi:MAG: hypothetical protein ACTHLX_21390 [Candidatus Binatia bacterium]